MATRDIAQGGAGARGTAPAPRLGFVGVGAMGAPMATNLIARFGPMPVYDIVADRVKQLVERGARGDYMHKDVTRAVDLARDVHSPALVANVVTQIFEAADAAGGRDDYHPIVVKVSERLANVEWPARTS